MPDPRFAVVAERWFDGDRLHDDPVSAVVADGRIVDLTPGDATAALTAAGIAVTRGGFLMPGLVDAHVHLFLDGAPTDARTRSDHLKQDRAGLIAAARASAHAAFAHGVTLVRDAGDRHGINHLIRDEAAAAGDLPRVVSGGIGVKRPRRYGAFMARDVADDAAIVASVRELAAVNDEIKIILTGIIDFAAGAVTDEPQFDAESARLAADTARASGRRSFAHCSGEKGLAVAVAAGIDSIEHGFFMTDAILERMAEQDIAWTPTFCPVHFQWAYPEAAGWPAATVDNLRRILDHHARSLARAHHLGVRLLVGTDAGSMGVEHGRAVGQEIARFVEAGLPLAAALHAATRAPRRHFGRDDGGIERGAPFDAALFAGMPFGNDAPSTAPLAVWRQS